MLPGLICFMFGVYDIEFFHWAIYKPQTLSRYPSQSSKMPKVTSHNAMCSWSGVPLPAPELCCLLSNCYACPKRSKSCWLWVPQIVPELRCLQLSCEPSPNCSELTWSWAPQIMPEHLWFRRYGTLQVWYQSWWGVRRRRGLRVAEDGSESHKRWRQMEERREIRNSIIYSCAMGVGCFWWAKGREIYNHSCLRKWERKSLHASFVASS